MRASGPEAPSGPGRKGASAGGHGQGQKGILGLEFAHLGVEARGKEVATRQQRAMFMWPCLVPFVLCTLSASNSARTTIVKPFSLRELLARVRAVLRRQEMGQAALARDPERGGYKFDGWLLERRGRRLLDPDAMPVSLSKSEYALLLAFLEAPQQPLSREHLLQATRIREDICDRSIDVQVLRLRRKLETNPSAPRVI